MFLKLYMIIYNPITLLESGASAGINVSESGRQAYNSKAQNTTWDILMIFPKQRKLGKPQKWNCIKTFGNGILKISQMNTKNNSQEKINAINCMAS